MHNVFESEALADRALSHDSANYVSLCRYFVLLHLDWQVNSIRDSVVQFKLDLPRQQVVNIASRFCDHVDDVAHLTSILFTVH